MKTIDEIATQAQQAIVAATDLPALNQLRVHYLGKKGILTEQLKMLSQLPVEERPQFGQQLNQIKKQLQQLIKETEKSLINKELSEKLHADDLDVSLPSHGSDRGSAHPINRVRERIEQLFMQVGFRVAEGPEIETEAYNFDALNIPAHHPAREMQDTFYLKDKRVLRTHTSPVQIRTMLQQAPPLRVIAPGRVYRHDFDVTHTPMFHQVEGLLLDEHSNFAELKGLLIHFVQQFFEQPLATRFRPSYFPFTEPSAEMDIECVLCHGSGQNCRVCKGTGWLEILGCGMVHPNVLNYVNIDSEKYRGFAFGMGIDRIAMLRYGINDLRMMFDNDIRFLQQF